MRSLVFKWNMCVHNLHLLLTDMNNKMKKIEQSGLMEKKVMHIMHYVPIPDEVMIQSF